MKRLLLCFLIPFCLPLSAQAASTLPEISFVAGRYQETVAPETVATWFHLDTARILVPGYTSEIENPVGCPEQDPNWCAFVRPVRYQYATKVILKRALNPETIRTFLDKFDDKVTLAPQDAIFAGDENGKVYVKSEEKLGQSLDTNASYQKIVALLGQDSEDGHITEELPVNTEEPKIKASDKERLGLNELVGEGHSDFAGSPKNRLYNIKRALQQFQGVIVPAGEEFSFVKNLGDVDGEHGYLPELVIKDNKTTPEFGGGICQVSTTVFRAAIYSGMKITARRNHAYPVRYYTPYGMDATVYIPNPDFRFVNNTGHAIFMQSEIEGTTLTFRFFGTNDGRKVSVDGPHILEHNPDGSMKTIFTQIVTDASGQEMFRQEFPSNYKSPSLFPHEGAETVITTKPEDWSKSQWNDYKKLHNL